MQKDLRHLWEHCRKGRIRTMDKETVDMLTQLGYNPVLKCWANGHIQVKSKMGVKWNYYAHSGTIVGFHYKKIGLSELIKLLDDK